LRLGGEGKGKKSTSILLAGGFVIVVFVIGLIPLASIKLATGLAAVDAWQSDWNVDNGLAWININGKTYTSASDFAVWRSMGDLYGQHAVSFNPIGKYSDWQDRWFDHLPQGTPDMNVVVGGLVRCDEHGNPVSDDWYADRYVVNDREYVLFYYKFDVMIKCSPIVEAGGWSWNFDYFIPIPVYQPPYAASETMSVTVGAFVDANTVTMNPETNIRFQNAYLLGLEKSTDQEDFYPTTYPEGGWPHIVSTAMKQGQISTFQWNDQEKQYVVEVSGKLRCGYYPHFGSLGDVVTFDGKSVWIKFVVLIETLVDGPVQEDPKEDKTVIPVDDDIGQVKSNWEIFWDNFFQIFGGFNNWLIILAGVAIIGLIVAFMFPRIAQGIVILRNRKRGG